MLGDRHRDRGQFLHLPAHRIANRYVLVYDEEVSTATALGPVLDHPIDGPRRQQRTPAPLMTSLGALLATRRILAALRCAGRRIGARGTEELRELRFSRRSSWAMRSS